jgi:hypothetical protein
MYIKIIILINYADKLGFEYPHTLLLLYQEMISKFIRIKVIYHLRKFKRESVKSVLDQTFVMESDLDEMKVWLESKFKFKKIKKKLAEFNWLIMYVIDEIFLYLKLFKVIVSSTTFFFQNIIDWFYTSLKIQIMLYLTIVFNRLLYLSLCNVMDSKQVIFTIPKTTITSHEYEFDITKIYDINNYILYIIIRFFNIKDLIYLFIIFVKLMIITVKKYKKILSISGSLLMKIVRGVYKLILLIKKFIKIIYKIVFYHEMDIKKLVIFLKRYKINNYLIFVIENYSKWIYLQFRVVFYAICLLIIGILIRMMDWVNFKLVSYNSKQNFDDSEVDVLNILYWLILIFYLYKSNNPSSMFGKTVVFSFLLLIQSRIIF